MIFECDNELTLDESATIQVRSKDDEYIFSLTLDLGEIRELELELEEAKEKIFRQQGADQYKNALYPEKAMKKSLLKNYKAVFLKKVSRRVK
jgi:hypothetical protein